MNREELAEHLRSRQNAELLGALGQGGMGTVWAVRKNDLQRVEALKVFSNETANDTNQKARFQQEMRTLASLRHPAIVEIFNSDVTPEGVPYFFMRYVEGNDLHTEINHRKTQNQPFSVEQTVEILMPIASALDYLHGHKPDPIIHRDIKPANILLPAENAGQQSPSVLTDFGISIVERATRLTSPYVLIGTESYCAPELFQSGNSDYLEELSNPTPATDNYALGLIAFEMLTLVGARQTRTTEQWRFNRGVPDFDVSRLLPSEQPYGAKIKRVIEKQLDPIPANRYGSAQDFLRALVEAVGKTDSLNYDTGRARQTAPEETKALPLTGRPGEYSQYNRRKTRVGRDRSGRSRSKTPIVLTLVLLVAVPVGGYVAFNKIQEENGAIANTNIAKEFPKLVGKNKWRGYRCKNVEPGDGQVESVQCQGNGEGIVITQFSNQEALEASIPEGNVSRLSNGICEISKITSEGNEYLIPEHKNGEFALLLWGNRVAERATEVPVC
ncbi:hypothetical protein HMPREF2547_08130 [Corynebacterium sp. HMSC055G02]|nr:MULTISPECIES: serine/threonine-protein kinase [unclassified Corynebacterium]MBC6797400.1 serine/threonine protein kinase [Corynebacterium sp. LK31]MBC6830850.1 serine/threonine protein kinase [Corynebacterium sp. LK32]OFN54990.1 hypothetical protein HMPREF2547_08130 [Corynebacterium sp. HMSC055G02]